MEHYSVIKKDEIRLLPATWMDLEIVMLSEVSLTEKEKYCMTSLTCGIYKVVELGSSSVLPVNIQG